MLSMMRLKCMQELDGAKDDAPGKDKGWHYHYEFQAVMDAEGMFCPEPGHESALVEDVCREEKVPEDIE